MSATQGQNQGFEKTHLRVPYPVFILFFVSFALYVPTLFYSLTGLDDFIMVYRLQQYNSSWHHLLANFSRGSYGPWVSYYRPFFYDTILVNSHLFGTNLFAFHLINVLCHPLTVVILFHFLKQLNIKALHAFILCLFFAVHPVLVQAVAWLPGRNDTLLTMLLLSYFVFAIKYAQGGRPVDFVASLLFLLLALFTKETALLGPFCLVCLLVLVCDKKPFEQRMLWQYFGWVFCFAVLWAARLMAHKTMYGLTPSQSVKTSIQRIPILWQYIGKILLPFNLSVFPNQQDTANSWGIGSMLLLAVILFESRKKANKIYVLGGLAFFVLFLIPSLAAPQDLISKQVYEHRLYLPIIGILIMLPQTIIFNNRLTDRQLLGFSCTLFVGLIALNLRHQGNFSSPEVFWRQAVATAPSSAHAAGSLAWQVSNKNEALQLLEKTIHLNPNEQYINFRTGFVYHKFDSMSVAQQYFLREKSISNYYECDFYLAHIALVRGETPEAVKYTRNYIKYNPYFSHKYIESLLSRPEWNNEQTAIKLITELQHNKLSNYFEN